MDETAANIIDRERALANFDHARDDFLDAMGSVPDDALEYKPEGDDYTVGDLVPHIAGNINMYGLALDMMRQAEFGEVRMAAMPDGPARVEGEPEVELAVPIGAEARVRDLEELERLHDTLAGKLRELMHEEHGRQAPVFYPGAEEAYPTSAADILKWLTDHYREHTQQIADMVGSWRLHSDNT